MNTIIGVKQFHKDFKKVVSETKKGKTFVVVNRTEPLMRVGPVIPQPQKSMADLFKIHFKGDKNLSKDIDKILYGAKK